MKVTICQMRNEGDGLRHDWESLVIHATKHKPDLVLLPEMIFSRWLAVNEVRDEAAWEAAVKSHDEWLERLSELGCTVAGTRPVSEPNAQNHGFLYTETDGLAHVHTKYYLPNDAGFWEANWYERGEKSFEPFQAGQAKAGMMICTDVWFTEHARKLGREGIQLLLNPRATDYGTEDKWLAGARACAVVSGAFVLSSNHSGGKYPAKMGGMGWVVDPNGVVLGVTSFDEPYLTLDIDLNSADKAKESYPRYVLE